VNLSPLDKQRIWLATGLITAFCACLLVLLFKAFPPENKDIVIYMIGQLSGMSTMALGFYFTNKAGQDAQDEKKTDNTRAAFEAIAATAQAATPGGGAKQAAEQVADAAADEADRITEGPTQ
jgi:hypothetical protein